MTIGCNQIVACILKNCENLVPGIEDKAYFINYDCVDKDASTFDANNALLLTSLALKSASPPCYAYCVVGYNMSNEHKVSMVKKTYQKTWEHGFVFRIFDNTPEDKIWIENLKDSRFVVIIENKYNKKDAVNGNGRTVFEVLGWDFGLELNAAERDPNSDEMLGGWVLTAGGHDKMKESSIPLTFFDTDIATTRADIDALLAPCCP
jgi:hypothetical protein